MILEKFLVTGANGFVGSALCDALVQHGHEVAAAVRRNGNAGTGRIKYIAVGEINAHTDWSTALTEVKTVIHLAARVHVMHDSASNPLAEFRRMNVDATEHLARCAVASGARRLVYVSSIKVNGEETLGGRRYAERDVPAPQDPYGISKWEAEQALQRVAQDTGMEIVIVRPPLVYGAGVKGNFAQMLGVIARGIPLPFASVRNQRDLLYIGNLVDALVVCATHPKAAGQTYLLSDGESVSTPELLRRIATALSVPSRVFPFPIALLEVAGKMVAKSAQAARLLGSLQVDSGKIRHQLNWTPPYTLQQGLQATAEWYQKNKP